MKALNFITIWVLVFMEQYSWLCIFGHSILSMVLYFVIGFAFTYFLFYNFDNEHQPNIDIRDWEVDF